MKVWIGALSPNLSTMVSVECKHRAREKSMTPTDLAALYSEESWVRRMTASAPPVVHPNGTTALPMPERFWSKVDQSDTNGCWPWRAFRFGRGYGRFRRAGGAAMAQAHRVAYELAVGPIPDGLSVLHHCDNPPCVNPAHLWVGTYADNAHDRDAKGRGASLKGAENPYARLSAEQVEMIRSRYRTGVYGLRTNLAREFGVGPNTIWRIVTNRSYR